MERLSNRQVQVLDFVAECVVEESRAPTHQEIADELDIRRQTVTQHLSALVRKGYLLQPSGVHRGLDLTPLGWRRHLAQVERHIGVRSGMLRASTAKAAVVLRRHIRRVPAEQRQVVFDFAVA